MGRLRELKYEFIRTPLEQPLMRLRDLKTYFRRQRHPELRQLLMEPERIESVWKSIIRADTNCIDVGCHYGSVLSRFCSLAPKGRHVAVEPIPEKVAFLRRKFPDVDVRQLALSDTPGTAMFYVDREKSGFSGLAKHAEGSFRAIEVPCERLDTIVPRDRRFSVLKIDVEGAELQVLRSATELIHRDSPVILFECGPSGPSSFGYAAGDIQRFFLQLRYSVFCLEGFLNGDPAVDASAMEHALVFPFKAFNWIAVRQPASSRSD